MGYHNAGEVFHGSKPLGLHMKTYDTEATAINATLKTVVDYAKAHNATPTHIFADNQAAMQTAFDVTPGS